MEEETCSFGCGTFKKVSVEKTENGTYTKYECPKGHKMVKCDKQMIPFPFPFPPYGVPYELV